MTVRATLAGGVIALLAIVALTPSAFGQSVSLSTDPDEDQAQPTGPQAYQPQYYPTAPQPWAPSRRSMPIPPPRQTVRDRPVRLDELGVTPEGPPTATNIVYEQRIRGSSDAAEGLQGPLDGEWVISGGDGQAMFSLQLVDTGGYSPLEGAWRDLISPDGVEPVGLIDSLVRQPSSLTIQFHQRGEGAISMVLRSTAGGDWAGELSENGQTLTISMRRN